MPTRSTPASKVSRHLTVVPDDAQPTLWDTPELRRLARLRQLAIDSGQPAEAIRLIESAATADDALDLLSAAGLVPTAQEAIDGMLSWFAPLLDPGTDQLDAEIAASQFLATLRQNASADVDITVLLLGVLTDLERQPRPEALPMLRALSAVGPADVRSVAGTVADKTVAAGWPDVPWAAGLGTPSPGRCFGYDDTYNERRSLVITFSYGNSRHAVVTLVDDGLGGGIRDCQVCNYSERLRAEYRSLGQRPGLRYKDYDEAQARAILDDALAQPSCMPAHGRTGVGEDYLELLRARAALLPARPRPSRTRVTGAGNIHRLKVTLRGTKPPIWRRFEVPSDISLARLHTVIQIGFGWQNSHLHVFETPAGRYGTADPDLEIRGDKSKRLSAVADWPGDRIRYEYDFGDSWEHEIEVEAVQPAQPGVAYPRCTAGRQAGPPEDCGGVGGYYDLLDVLADPRHEQHEARLWWLGISSPSEFDAARFDRDAVNARLGRRATVLVRN